MSEQTTRIAEAAYQEWLKGPMSGHDCLEVAEIAARMALEQASDWQPMSTAPKDGTRIILGTTEPEPSGQVREGEWFDDLQCWSTFFDPTCWQPLPAAPTGKAEA